MRTKDRGLDRRGGAGALWVSIAWSCAAFLLGVVVVVAAPAAAVLADQPADLMLVSTLESGPKANEGSYAPAMSTDGSTVAFASFATTLDPRDAAAVDFDIYVKNMTTGEMTLASTSDDDIKGNGTSETPSVTADGTVVAFRSYADNLDPADADTLGDIYVKNVVTGDLRLVSSSDDGVKANAISGAPWISADGTTVAFWSLATNLDPNDVDSVPDVFVKNLLTGDIVLASTSTSGEKGDFQSTTPSLSADGTFVAFHSQAMNLVPVALPATDQVYVKNLVTGETVLASTSSTGEPANFGADVPSLSADGTRIAFASAATNFDPRDTDVSVNDIYVKDLVTGEVVLASTSDSGIKSNGGSQGGYPAYLSADGRRVAFQSQATNLDSCDLDIYGDAYVKDLSSGELTLVSLSDAGMKSNGSSFDVNLTSDGTTVAYSSTGANLDPADIDAVPDIYRRDVGTIPCHPGVVVSVNSASQLEGDAGKRPMVFTVSLSSPAPAKVIVEYSIFDGNADASDYSAGSGILEFRPGQTSKTIKAFIVGDRTVEQDEEFTVYLVSIAGATHAAYSGTGTILNDD